MLYMFQSRSSHLHVKQAWHKASEQDVNMYKTRLDELLNKIVVDDDVLHCSDINCIHHTDMISVLYHDVISACIIHAEMTSLYNTLIISV